MTSLLFSNPKAEMALVATVVADRRAWAECEHLQPDQFEGPACSAIWRVLQRHRGLASVDVLMTELAATVGPGASVPYLRTMAR